MLRAAISQNRGFTLIEILIVLFIMGLCTATLAINLSAGPSGKLVREAEQLALLLEDAALRARSRSISYEWRPEAGGYALQAISAAGEAPPAVRQFLLPEGIRIKTVRAGDGSALARIVVPGRGVPGSSRISLSSENQEIDVYSAGLNRYALSAPRSRSVQPGN